MSTTRKRGFTIIEVVLVLAVAGLIFLVVFAAIPRLQASRRDNARKDHARALQALILEYQANNGSRPHYFDIRDALADPQGPITTFYDYVEGQGIIDPSGSAYTWVNSATPGEGEFYYYFSYVRCGDPGGSFIWGQTQEDFVIKFGLERGEICLDQHGGF